MTYTEVERLVYSGNEEELQKFLETHDDTPIFFLHEPYTAIQKKIQANALTLLMDDPRFVFDDEFVGRMFYFSTGLTHRTVWNHPRMRVLLQDVNSISDYFYRRFPTPTWKQSAGIGQRYFQADTVIQYLRREDTKKRNQSLLFVLYPSMKRYVRVWLENHYIPGAPGYTRAEKEFLSLSEVHT